MSDNNLERIWVSIDSILNKLTNIEEKLITMARTEEAVKNHDRMISQLSNQVGTNSNIISKLELSCSSCNKDEFYVLVEDMQKDLSSIKENSAKESVIKQMILYGMKWTFGIASTILASILIYIITK
jgi:hypothetical protein